MQVVSIAEVQSAILGGEADGEPTAGRTEPRSSQGMRLVCCRGLGMWIAEPDASKSRIIHEPDCSMDYSMQTTAQGSRDQVRISSLGETSGLVHPEFIDFCCLYRTSGNRMGFTSETVKFPGQHRSEVVRGNRIEIKR